MDWQNIFFSFYPENTPMRQILLKHSMQVREKALSLIDENSRIDRAFVADAAMLHDIGIGKCHAPSIYCDGAAPYIAHGVLGAEMLRTYAKTHHADLEKYARICERHTGCGLSAAEIAAQRLPLPEWGPEHPGRLREQVLATRDEGFGGFCIFEWTSRVEDLLPVLRASR